jgi:aryl-alcohol dehydrogenase-like predicted oxidoreductase
MTSPHEIKKVRLGATGPEVFPLGLGCMGMSGMYGATDDAESIATIHAALEAGVSLIDTGDFYGSGHNEMLIGRALAGRRNQAIVSVKFGALRGPDGAWTGFDGRPAAVKNFAAYSLQRLGIDAIDVYRPSRLDPTVPIEETIGAIADLVKAGYVRHIGLSEVGPETVGRAQQVHPIADLQIEYSLASRGPEAKIFPALETLGIGATLYGVLSRGLFTGSKPSGRSDFRTHLPRFAGDNLAKNADVATKLESFARERDRTVAQVALGWTLARQPRFVSLVGLKTRAQLTDALGALRRPLSASDVQALEALVPESSIAGTRYGADQMARLDSER